MMITRRSMLLGIGAALAAPAIVRADSLMKLWVPKPTVDELFALYAADFLYAANLARIHAAVFGTGYIEHGPGLKVRSIDPFEIWDGIHQRDGYLTKLQFETPDRQNQGLAGLIKWDGPAKPTGPIIGADWPSRTIKAPPGGFKVV